MYNVFKILICRMSQLYNLRKKSNLNPVHYVSWVFFIGKQYMKTPIEVPIKVMRIIRSFSKMSIHNDPALK